MNEASEPSEPIADAGPLRPVPRRAGKTRVIGIDLARAAALVGMMATHLFPILDDDGTPSFAWEVFAGRSFALFVFLAGVGLALSTGGSHPPPPGRRAAAAASIASRAVLLGLIGLAIGFLGNTYIILAYYGVLFFLAIPLFTLSLRVLAGAALAIAVIAPFVMQGLRDHLPEPLYIDGTYINPTFSSLADPAALASELLLTGVYPAIPLLVYICAGLAVGRLIASCIGDADRMAVLATRLLAAGAALAVTGWVASSILLDQFGGLDRIRAASPGLGEEAITDVLLWGPDPTLPTSTSWWLAIRAPHSSTPLDLLHTTGTSMAVLGAMLLLGIAAVGALRPLATAGGMTLTLYVLHVFATEAAVLGEEPMVAFVIQGAAAVVFAVLWQQRFGQGPLERIVASVARRARDAVGTRHPRALEGSRDA